MEKDDNLYLNEQENNTDSELTHYGTPRHSGRYPWGSGENPYQHSGDWLSRVTELRKEGMTDKEISESMGMSTTQFRTYYSLSVNERKKDTIQQIKSMQSDGYSNVKIAEKLGLPGESTVRSLMKSDAESRATIAQKTADNLRDLVDEKGMIDIGTGTERELGITKEKMNQALELLKLEGYEVYGGRVPQATNPGKYTTLKVLCPPGTEHKEIFNYENIHSIDDYISRDGGDTFEKAFVYPSSFDSNRLAIRGKEDGGSEKDGVIELRRGVKDISLGESNYSQVRILVDGTHYIKGMAIYSDNLPDGIDILVNSNKSNELSKLDHLKKIKDDPENPFGSSIKERGGQSYYIDENGEKKLSVINKRADEGDWGEWSDHLPSQFLSKQPLSLIKKQLKLAESDKQDEFDEIMSLTNPTVKRSLLESFADDCDAASVHLQAAALPGQKYQVILPLTSIKDDEVYAPNFTDGSEVALIRYPHGGTFEIPICKVNNRNKEGKNIIGTNPADAIGINYKVAERLSGADFDGDTVMVIPLSEKIRVKSTNKLKELEGFDSKINYGPDEIKTINGVDHYYRGGKEYKVMKDMQTEMGKISNLITDMTLKGANDDELARAVKHSMVIVDSEKHHLDWKQSMIDNKIVQLRKKYQGKYNEYGELESSGGASTLISKSKSRLTIPERKEGAFFTKDGNSLLKLIDTDNQIYLDEKTGKVYNKKDVKTMYVDPNTGKKLYHDTEREYTKAIYYDKSGKKKEASVIVKDNRLYYKGEDGKYTQVSNEKLYTKKATQESTKMAEAEDARILSSGTPQEEAYASYANKLKSLANKARKEAYFIKDIPYSPSAKESYKKEVDSLNSKLNIALLNAPKERQAQTIAASILKAKFQDNPDMTNEQKRKASQQELSKARLKVGAKRSTIKITEKEWEAIQAGAISASKLKEIIANADSDTLKQMAMPRTTSTLSVSKINRMKSMANSGYTNEQIAKALGISSTTVIKYLKGKEE